MSKHSLLRDFLANSSLVSLTIYASILSKGCSLIHMLLLTYLTIPYLGRDGFGLWMTVNSFFVILSLFDFGLGNQVISKVSEIKDKIGERNSLINCVIGLTGLIGLFLLIIIISIYILNTKIKFIEYSNFFILVFLLIFLLNIFVNILSKVYIGLGNAHIYNIVVAFSVVVSSCVLYYCALNKFGIVHLMLATIGLQCIIQFIFLYFRIIKKYINIKSIRFDISFNFNKVKGSLFYFLMQVAATIGWSLDPLIISKSIGVNYVTDFNLVLKLYMLISVPCSLINAPLWVYYGSALGAGNYEKIKSTLKKSLYFNIVYSIIMTIIICIYGSDLIRFFSKDVVDVSFLLLLALGLWTILESVGNAFAMFLNGISIVKEQFLVVIIYTISASILKIISINIYGLEGMIFANVLVYFIIHAYFYIFFYKKPIFSKINNNG